MVLFLSLLIGLVYFFYSSNLYRNYFSGRFDRYGELLSKCDEKTNDGKRIYKCSALLNYVDVSKQEKDCIILSYISGDPSIENKEICEDFEIIEWDEEVFKKEERFPVYLEFIYTGNYIQGFSLEKIQIEWMTDDETSIFTNLLSEIGVSLTNLATRRDYNIEQSGYYFQPLSEEFFNGSVGVVNFAQARIKEFAFDEGIVTVNSELLINGFSRELTLISRKFLYQRDPMDENLLEVKRENLSDLDFNKEYQLSAFYLTKPIDEETFKKKCSNPEEIDIFTQAFCSSFETLEISEYVIDIEKYLNEQLLLEGGLQLDKVKFFYLVTYE